MSYIWAYPGLACKGLNGWIGTNALAYLPATSATKIVFVPLNAEDVILLIV